MRIMKRLFLSLMPAQAVSGTLPAVNILVVTFIVGKLFGECSLSAFGFTTVITLLVTVICSLISSGAQVLCGNFLGRGDKEKLSKTYNTALILSFVSIVIIAVPLAVFPQTVAHLLGADGDVFQKTVDCISGFSIGMPFMPLFSTLIIFLQYERMDKVITVSSLIMMIINVGGNFANALLIGWGMFGVGFFTSVGNSVAVIISLIAIAKKKNLFIFNLKQFDVGILKGIFKNGSVMTVNCVCCTVRTAVVNRCMYSVAGTVGLSALTLANNIIDSLGELFVSGIFGAGCSVAGILVGDRDTFSLKKMTKTLSGTIIPMMAVLYAVIFFAAKPLALLGGAAAENLDYYAMIIRVANCYLLISCFFSIPYSIYRGLENVKVLIILNIACLGILCPLTCYLLSGTLGSWFVSFMAPYQNILCILGYYLIVIIKTKHLPRSVFDIVYIPDNTGARENSRLQITVSTVEEAIEASEKARKFCIENMLDRKKAYFASLCIEEMAVDTVKNRFKKKSTLDIHIVCEDGKANIMLRDDLKFFDPTEWLKLCSPEDEYRSLGIKTVSKLSTKMNYMNTLGLNVLSIEI